VYSHVREITSGDATEQVVSEPAPLPDEARGEAPGRGRLAGRRILVVGGGQEDDGLEDPPIGNGRAMSILFAREGAAVAVADISAAWRRRSARRATA
jgi:hypothetical protein